jgi:opacity protein-like surface antigen
LGINQGINHSAEGIHIASGGVRWSHMWSAKGRGFLRGHPSFAMEFVPAMAFITSDHTTWAVGGNIMYEHHFAVSGRVLPVWKLGAGTLHATNPIPAGETAFNFTILTALGVDVMITDKDALYLGYRFHHVSNANIGTVNPGINVHTIVFGVSFYR